MNIKQKVVMLSVAFCMALGTAFALNTNIVAAQEDPAPVTDRNTDTERNESKNDCNDIETSIIPKSVCGDSGDNTSAENSTIWNLLLALLRILTAGIGIAAVGGIVFGALLYTTAGNSPEQTKRAVGIITNVVIGLVAYALMYIFLNFLIPGGIFKL